MRFRQNKLLLTVLIITALTLSLLFGCSPSLSQNENSNVQIEKPLFVKSSRMNLEASKGYGDFYGEQKESEKNISDNEAPKLQDDIKKEDVSSNQPSDDISSTLSSKETSPIHDKYMTSPVPEGKPSPVEPEDSSIGETALSCTISVTCYTILDNMEKLNPDKTELVPKDGWILKPIEVTFYEGESVFNVLSRTLKQNKIHMEFENTPIYNSAYIEGIGNLYEFDCGDLSGWMYKVNDWFPNYGCSRYQLKDGDIIEWIYTCDLGHDIGGRNAAES